MKNIIAVCRLIRDTPQKELAYKLGISFKHLCCIEKGHYKTLNFKTAYKVSRILNFPLEVLFPAETENKPKDPYYFIAAAKSKDIKKKIFDRRRKRKSTNVTSTAPSIMFRPTVCSVVLTSRVRS